MDQDTPAKPREQKVTGLRTTWKILLLILCLLRGSSMTPPYRRPHSRWPQAGSPQLRTHLYSMEAHTAPTPLCCWKNSISGTNALRGPRLVSGETGGAVTIRCHYAPSSVNRHQRKYWCRLGPPLWICNTIVSTNQYIHHDYRGRVALTDAPQSGLLTVRLLQLSLGDMGHYRCGIGDRNDMLFFSVNLTVSAGPSNTTYAAAPASHEPITAPPGAAASSAANKWTSGLTQILESQGSEWNRTAPTTGTSKTTPSANRGQTLRTARTTVPGTSSREEGSNRAAVLTLEGPAPKSRSMFSTTQGVWMWSSRNSVTTSATTSEGRKQDTVPETDGPQDETDINTSPDTPRKTTGTTRPSDLISENVTWGTLQDETEVSKQHMLYPLEKSSPAPRAQTLNATCTDMAFEEGRTNGSLENTTEESGPSAPSPVSVVDPVWVSGQGSSLKSAFTEGESNSQILTPVSTVLALLLIAALVLLKRRLGRQRTSQKTERVARVTLIQMTHFLPDEGKNLQRIDLPTQESLTVPEKDSGL